MDHQVAPPAGGWTLYAERWYLLFAFSLTTFSQCLFWITFSPVADETSQWLSTSKYNVDLLLNWGPIIFIPVTPLSIWLAERPGGLRLCVRAAAWMTASCVLLRCVVCLWPAMFLAPQGGSFDAGLALLHLAQIINAAVGPLVMNTPTQLSQTWFGEHERTTATAIGVLANNFGAAVGFLLGPALVQGDPARLPRLLYAHAAFGVLGSAMILAHFPAEPKTPPSRAAAEMRLRAAAAAEGDGQQPLLGGGGARVGKPAAPAAPSLLGSLRACFANRSFVLVAVAGGVTNGVFNGWSGLLSVIMGPLGYSDAESGWFGFAVTIACISGGIASGRLADTCFQRRFKRVLLVTLALCLFAFCWWTLSLPSALWGGDHGGQPPPLPSDEGSLLAAVVLAGLALGATSPLFYELVLELLYPLPEAYGAGIMSLFNNIGAVLFLAIPPSVHDTMNVVMALVVAGAFVLVSLVVEKYNRAAAADEK